MSEILVVSGHTDLENSFVNKIILGELKKHLPEAKFDMLSELYKNYVIDVKAEQEKLVKADVIVLVRRAITFAKVARRCASSWLFSRQHGR